MSLNNVVVCDVHSAAAMGAAMGQDACLEDIQRIGGGHVCMRVDNHWSSWNPVGLSSGEVRHGFHGSHESNSCHARNPRPNFLGITTSPEPRNLRSSFCLSIHVQKCSKTRSISESRRTFLSCREQRRF